MALSPANNADLAFVLHTLAWRETSLIVEMFTREHGRLGMIAKGARRPRSALRGLLQPFQPLEIRWAGKSELRHLIGAEWVGGLAPLSGQAIMPGFYVNELMVRLMPREDAHPQLFDDYLATLGLLAKGVSMQGGGLDEHLNASSGGASSRETTEPILRRFECNLLREMGYAPAFDRETRSGDAVTAQWLYDVSPVTGVARIGPAVAKPGVQEPVSQSEPEGFHGATLLALASADQSMEQAVAALQDPVVATESKRLLRMLLGHHLGDEGLASRQVMRDLVRI